MLQGDHSGSENLAALCEHLRSERLLVGSEQFALQTLNSKVQNELTELSKLIWICRHERLALHRLINSDPSVSPDNCNQLVCAINASEFSEGYKGFGYHITSVSQIYRILLQAPRTAAEFLNATEKLSLNVPLNELNRAMFNVIYGSCVFPHDEKQMLDLLAHLISLQLLSNPDPRRLLRKGNVTFSRMYRYFSEELSSAKIFLTAALHEPVMFLLSQDELFLDIDASKSPIRFPTEERKRRFGVDENSRLYKEKVARHRQLIVEKLAVIGEKFVEGIRRAMTCFPLSLTWLVRQLHTSLIERKHVTKDEAALICTDLIFTCFLCSAIINPEPLGIISDTPISHISRFNLIQVGQILQTLALLPYERPPAYMEDVLQRFDQTAMPQVVRSILSSDSISLESVFPSIVCDANGVEVYSRRACVGTLQEVNTIHLFLKSAAIDEIADAPVRKNLKSILKKMPSEFVRAADSGPARSSNGDIRNLTNILNNNGKFSSTNSIPSRSNSSGKLRNLADKVQNAASKGHQRLMQNSPSQGLNSRSSHPRLMQSLSNNFLAGSTNSTILEVNGNGNIGSNSGGTDAAFDYSTPFEAYFIPLLEQDVPIGLASEESIMQNFSRLHSRKHKNSETEKRTRFVAVAESVVSDRTTNTDVVSDEDGGASRHRSSHSSSSSNEDDDDVVAVGVDAETVDQAANDDDEDDDEDDDDVEEDISTLPDNFSDVVPISANVSARGSRSPSLSGERNSGRGTPFSVNANEQNETSSTVPGAAVAPPENRRTLPTIPVTVRKQNPEGLEEKFGKFTLPPQDSFRYHDETYSLVSDSWSTDVVASDNEGFNESRIDATVNFPPPAPPVGAPIFPPMGPPQLAQFVPVQQPQLPLAQHMGMLPQVVFQRPTQNNNPFLPALNPQNPFLPLITNTVNNGNNFVNTNSDSGLNLNSEELEEAPYYDPKNLAQCRAFLDVKRKLRLVLSTASNVPRFCHTRPKTAASPATADAPLPSLNGLETTALNNPFSSDMRVGPSSSSTAAQQRTGDQQHPLAQLSPEEASQGMNSSPDSRREAANELNEFLQILLAESINSRERTQAAQIREVQRCLTVFDNRGIRKLVRTLKVENRKRTSYLLYLQQSKLTLLQLDYHLSRTKIRLQREQQLTAECLIEILVRFNLEKKDMFLRQFIDEFQHLGAQDEKTDAVNNTLVVLYESLAVEPMWRHATPENLDYARKSMERALMSHIYLFALYPNGDADHCRDELFHKSMQRLASMITVTHPDLDIPKKFHGECPWPSAQAEISIINAYKSPRDKVACVVRCCETVENLMALSSSNRADNASADDILPVIVYVLLQANPPTLLSNIQYVEDFYASRMQGEEAYWWTQITSSVEFIKQLLTKF